jgi:hypothetical protein
MARHGIVNKDGVVVNVVIWEGAEWLPPRDHYVVQHDQIDIGDSYDTDKQVLTKADRTTPDPVE